MRKLKTIIRVWLPFAVVISAFSLLAYASVQQTYRQGANDPQIQMANDAANSLMDGKSVDSLLPAAKIPVEKSLSPFLIFYDNQGQVLGSSVTLNGATPQLPDGVLQSTREMGGENRRTWAPREGIRIAAVIVSYRDGFVLAGRNLREVEAREAQTSNFASLTWVLAIIGTLIVIAFGEFFLADPHPHS